jgi:hypothetical protein
MATAPESAATDLDERGFNAAALVRTASWGIGAAAALFLAVLAGLSDPGGPRVAAAVSSLTGKDGPEKAVTRAEPVPPPAPIAAVPPSPQLLSETRRLNEQVRLLAADRDRLLVRITAVERNLDDVTGSIRRQETSAPPATQAAPAANAAAPIWPAIVPEPPATAWTTSLPSEPPVAMEAEVAPAPTGPPATPLPPPRPVQVALATDQVVEPASEIAAAKPATARSALAQPGKPEPRPTHASYGIDLGGAVSIDRLRMLWHTLQTSAPPGLLKGLRPITHARDVRRGGRPDVRLIVGPLATAEDAARLCAIILNAGRYCEPAVFHGQRMSWR